MYKEKAATAGLENNSNGQQNQRYVSTPQIGESNIDISFIRDFLEALKPNTDVINLRFFTPDRDKKKSKKIQLTFSELIGRNGVNTLSKINETHGIYFVVNDGGDTDDEITCLNACFVESDTKSIADQNLSLNVAPIETSARIETKKSVHAYYLLTEGYSKDNCETEEEWQEILAKWREAQIRLIHYFGGDKAIKNPARVMRLPEFDHLSKDSSRKQIKLTQLELENRYTLDEILEAFPAPLTGLKADKSQTTHTSGSQPKPGRFESFDLDECKREAGKRIRLIGKENKTGKVDFKCPQHSGNGNTSAFYDPKTNNFHCNYCKDNLDIKALLEHFKVHLIAGNTQDDDDEWGQNDDDDLGIISQKDKKQAEKKAFFDTLLKDDLTGKAIEKPEFIIKGLVEKEVINLFVGPKKIGKSMFLQAGLCAYWITGKSPNKKMFPDLPESYRVLYFTTEDTKNVIHMRMSMAGVKDFSNFRVVENFTQDFNLKHGMGHILNIAYNDNFKADIIIIDPLASYFKGGDLNNGNEIRECLDPLRACLKSLHITPIINHHFNKLGNVANSEQIGAAARIINEFHYDRNMERLLIPTGGNNTASGGKSIKFSIESDPADDDLPILRVVGYSDTTVYGLKPDDRREEKKYIVEVVKKHAKKKITDKLTGKAHYWMRAKLLEKMCYEKFGISQPTVNRRRNEIGIIHAKFKNDAKELVTYVRLPDNFDLKKFA